MRADYFDKYASVMPTLTRMRREGAWFSEARSTVLPTVTGVGHATVGTGTDPRIHGITTNTLYNRVIGKWQQAYDQLDPRELMALTLADIWNIQTDGRAIIIGHGGAIRATAGLVGRGACLLNGRRGAGRELQHERRGMGNQPRLLHDARGAEGVHGQASLGSGGRHVDGPRHRQPVEVPRLGRVPEVRSRSAARGHGSGADRRRRHRPISCS